MRGTVKFLLALAVAFVVMLAFRGLVMTVCTIEGEGLAPQFMAGDRVVVFCLTGAIHKIEKMFG